MVTYDPAILQQFVESLYSKARALEIAMTFFAGGIGGVIGVVIALALQSGRHLGSEIWIFPLVCISIAAPIGFSIGRSMAFAYRLQAQQALCQMAIEQNTRASRSASA